MISLESRPQRSDQVMVQESAGTLLLFDVDDGEYFALNDVGRSLWALCDGTRSIAALASVLSAEYDAPLETIEADVLALVRELSEERLVIDRQLPEMSADAPES